MDSMQVLQDGDHASTRTTLPRAEARRMGAPLTHAEGSVEPNSGTTGPSLGREQPATIAQAASETASFKVERRSMVLLQEGAPAGASGSASGGASTGTAAA